MSKDDEYETLNNMINFFEARIYVRKMIQCLLVSANLTKKHLVEVVL